MKIFAIRKAEKQMLYRCFSSALLLGIVGVSLYNWRQWRHDRSLVTKNNATEEAADFESWQDQPKTSVLVAAWNEAAQIEGHIRSFLDLRYPYKQLVLCAGGTDGTYDLAHRFASTEVIVLKQEPGEGKQKALQRCLAISDGTVIYLSDADCVFSDTAFIRLIRPIVLNDANVTTGISVPQQGQLSVPIVQYQWFNDLYTAQHMPLDVEGVLGRNCALKRSVLHSIGGFDTPAQTGTDYLLSRLIQRAGFSIRAVPTSRIVTDYAVSSQVYVRTWRRWIKNLLIHGPRFGAWNDVKGVMVAFALYSMILLLPLMTPILGPIAWQTSLFCLFSANVNRLRRLLVGAQISKTKTPINLVLSLPYFTFLDMTAVLLAIRDYLVPELRSQW